MPRLSFWIIAVASVMYQWYISFVAAKVAKIFKNGRSQAVRIPKEFRVDTDEVLIERKGKKLILTPRVVRPWRTWAEYFAHQVPLSADFPDYVPDPPPKPIKGW